MTEAARAARNAYKREYRTKNREKINAYRREWSQKNPEKVRRYELDFWERKAQKASANLSEPTSKEEHFG